MTAARYRATINGFWCHHETKDSFFDADGYKDEVFLTVNVRVIDQNGVVLHNFDSESEVMGDANHPNRIRVGTGGPNGGIRTGDRFPVGDPVHHNGLNVKRYPAYLIWEGELQPGRDMVMLTTAIFEDDNGPGFMQPWLDWQVKTDKEYGQRAKDIFGKIWPVAAPFFDAVSLGIQTVGSLSGIWSPLGREGRRPIGLRRDPQDSNNAVFNPSIIALNSETAEYLATSNLQGLGNGILEIRYVDDPYLEGVYSIFVQIEKLSDGDVPIIAVQDDWRWCNKCQGLYWGGAQAQSRCPAGDQHAAQAQSHSGNYSLPHDGPTSPTEQSYWHWCNKCQGLFWGLSVDSSRCPAGGTHSRQSESGSSVYNLSFGLPDDPHRQRDWRWCNKCQGLFWGGGQSESRCPAAGTHAHVGETGSSDYSLIHLPPPPELD